MFPKEQSSFFIHTYSSYKIIFSNVSNKCEPCFLIHPFFLVDFCLLKKRGRESKQRLVNLGKLLYSIHRSTKSSVTAIRI